jgi:WD40 repeat protein
MAIPGELVEFYGHRGAITQIRFSPDTERVLTAGLDDTVKIWPTKPSRGATMHRALNSRCEYAAANVQDHLVAVADSSHAITVIDDRTGQDVLTLPPGTSQVIGMRVSRQSDVLVVADLQHIRAWSLATGQSKWTKDSSGGANGGVVLSPNGDKTAGWAAGVLSVWESKTGTELFRLPAEQIDPEFLGIGDADFSPDGKYIAVALGSGSVVVNSANGSIILRLASFQGLRVQTVRFNHSGNELATTVPVAGQTELWSTTSGKRLQLLSQGGFATSFSNDDSLLLTTSVDGLAALWNVDSGERTSLLTGSGGPIVSGSFSMEGRRVLTAALDGSVRIWHPETSQEVSTLAFHQGSMRLAYYTADGHRLVIVSAGGVAIYPALVKDLRETAEALLTNVISNQQRKRLTTR